MLAVGTLRTRRWTSGDGERRHAMSLVVDEIGPTLRWATFSRGFTESEGSSARNPRAEAAS